MKDSLFMAIIQYFNKKWWKGANTDGSFFKVLALGGGSVDGGVELPLVNEMGKHLAPWVSTRNIFLSNDRLLHNHSSNADCK